MFNQTDTMKASLHLQHSQVVERTQTTLSYQHKIQSHNTIPKKHRPRPPIIVDSALNKTHAEFQKEYNKLFQQSLQESIGESIDERESKKFKEGLDSKVKLSLYRTFC